MAGNHPHMPADGVPSGDDDFAKVHRLIQRGGKPVDVAHAFALLGWPIGPCDHRADLPGKKRAKAPLTPKGKKDASGKKIAKTGGLWEFTTDPERVAAYWRKNPKALIGVRTGLEIKKFVLDADVEPGETVEEVLKRLADAVGPIPAGPITITQSGGMHLWFEMPDGVEVRNSAGRIRGIDWRGEGGFVVMPPSSMEDGKAYSWAVAPWEKPFPQPTPRILDFVLQRGDFAREKGKKAPASPDSGNPATGRKPQKPTSRPASSPADRRKKAAALTAFDEEISTLEGLSDDRNNQLFRSTANLAEFVAAGYLSQPTVEAALERASHTNGEVEKKGLQSVLATIASGMRTGLAKPRDLSHIDEDAARKEARRSSSSRPPEPPEPSDAPTPPQGSSRARSTSPKPEDPFPLPASTGFAWRSLDGEQWLCTAEQKMRRDKETGDDIPWTKYDRISTPFQVYAWLHIIAGTEKGTGLRIALIDPKTGELSTVDIRRSQLSGRLSGTVLERLYDAGLQIEQEKTVAQILRSMRPKKEITIVPCTGWHELPGVSEEPVFALPAGCVLGQKERPGLENELDRSVSIPAGDAMRGTLEGWSKGIAAVFADERVKHLQLGVMAGFAGPILTLAGLDSCGLVWTGMTSGGKSTAQKLAVSVWSRTEINKPGLMKSAHTTVNAVEGLLANATGTFLALDELALCDGKQIGKLIFAIASGTGKERMNSDGTMRQSRNWQTFVTLSSEQSLEKRVIDDGGVYTEGAALRILDIDVSSLDKSPKPGLFEQIELAEQNYGHAGPAFVQSLMNAGLHKRGDELRHRIIDAAQTLANGEPGAREDDTPSPSPALIRAAQPLAIVQVAAELAQEFGLLPKDADCAKAVQWAWDRFREASDRLVISPEERAIEALSLFIAQRWDVSIRAMDASRPAMREAEGWYDDKEICIPVDLLSRAAGNILPQKVLAKVLKGKGLLARTDAHHNTVRARDGKRFLRFYALSREHFASKPIEKSEPPASLTLQYKD
jgi:hypothetical protein